MVTVRDRVVALGTAEPVSADAAEVAFLVDEDLHGHGLGSLLLEHLAAACRDRGIRRFVAEVLADNHAMLGVFLDAGFEITQRLRGRHRPRRAGDRRLRRAPSPPPTTARAGPRPASSRPLLYPRSVAVTGVRRDGTGIGAAVLGSIQAGGFTGTLYVVHPSGADGGRRARPPRASSTCPSRVDLAIVAVPAERVLDALRDAAEAGVPAAVVISSGFEEMGAEGAALQREMLDLARVPTASAWSAPTASAS